MAISLIHPMPMNGGGGKIFPYLNNGRSIKHLVSTSATSTLFRNGFAESSKSLTPIHTTRITSANEL